MDFKTLFATWVSMIKTQKAKLDNAEGMIDAVNITIMLGVIVIAGLIVIFIADRVNTATGTISQANLSAAQTSILGVGQTGYSFIIILVIAFIGAVAIGYVFGLLPGGGKK